MAGSVTANSPTPSSSASVIQQKAEAVATDMSGNQSIETKAINPAILQQIIAAILAAVNALTSCNVPPAKATAIMNRPGPIHRLGLRRAVRQNVVNPALHDPVFHSCLNVSATLLQSDVSSMMAEAQQ